MADLEATFGLDYSQFRQAASEVRRLGVRTAGDVSGGLGKSAAGTIKDLAKAFTNVGLGAGAAYAMIASVKSSLASYTDEFGDLAAEMKAATKGQEDFGRSLARDIFGPMRDGQSALSGVASFIDMLRTKIVNLNANMWMGVTGQLEPGEFAEDADAARLANEQSIASMKTAVAESKKASAERRQAEEDNIRRQDEYMQHAQRRADFEAKEAEASAERQIAEIDRLATIGGLSAEMAAEKARLAAEIQRSRAERDTSIAPDQRARLVARLNQEAAQAEYQAGAARRAEIADAEKLAQESVDQYERESRLKALRESGHQTQADLAEIEYEAVKRKKEIEDDLNLSYEARRRLMVEIAGASEREALALIAARRSELVDRIDAAARGRSTRTLAPGLGLAAAGFAFGIGGGVVQSGGESQKMQAELVSLNKKQAELLEQIRQRVGGPAKFGR